MYSLILLSFIISLLARGDFLGIIIGVYIYTLFLHTRSSTLQNLKSYLKINLGAVCYDCIWLFCHFSGYWNGNEYEHAEIGLKKWTYAFSMISFLVKIALLISVYLSYTKGISKEKNKDIMSKNKFGNNSLRNSRMPAK